MARILDKDTRLIDVDFGPVRVNCVRAAGSFNPTNTTTTENGINQLLLEPVVASPTGSFVQYSRVDLEYMTLNNEVMQPVDVSVQRTSPVPLGFNNNGNTFDQLEEYIYIFSRPLNNEEFTGSLNMEDLRVLGLDRSQVLTNVNLGGVDSGLPTKEQTIYAEKRVYSYSQGDGASVQNGQLVAPPLNPAFNELQGMPRLDSVTTWGSLGAITGPSLHCYRVVINRTQVLPPIPNVFAAEPLDGQSDIRFPPCNVSFLCKDPNYTEGQYLTRLSNAMNNIPEGGPTA
jgi:hypothetical protein